jgi:chromate transporter
MAAAIWLVPNPFTQFIGLGIAGLVGAYFLNDPQKQTASEGKFKFFPFAIFALLVFLPPALEGRFQWLNLFDSFYQAGTFVFGGGHVVLPLLQNILGDSIEPDRFLLGYAAAQAVPGPMFSLASFLGAELSPGQSLTGALIATAGIFLPGFLLVLAFQGAWERLASYPLIAKAAIGINASVVGLLVAALYDPVFLSAVKNPYEMALVIAGIFLLRQIKIPIFGLVTGFALLGYVLSVVLPATS